MSLHRGPVLWQIVRADGKCLADTREIPFRWSDRRGLMFLSRDLAEKAARKWFLGRATMASHGIRVVRA